MTCYNIGGKKHKIYMLLNALMVKWVEKADSVSSTRTYLADVKQTQRKRNIYISACLNLPTILSALFPKTV